MKNAIEIMRAIKKLGGRLEPAGDRLVVIPGKLCPPDVAIEASVDASTTTCGVADNHRQFHPASAGPEKQEVKQS